MQQIGLRDPQETVARAGCVEVFPRDDASRVDDRGECAWGARHIQGGDEGAIGSSHEAVTEEVRVVVRSRDGPAWVDAADEGTEGTRGPWRIERRDGAIGRPQEAVTDEVCVRVASRDGPRWVDPGGGGAVDGARDIELGEGTIGSAQETVKHEACVSVEPRDGPRQVNPSSGGQADGAWDIERGEGAVGRPQETVDRAARVKVEPCDRPRRVDALGVDAVDIAWDVERGEGAVGRPQEAVTDEACVRIASRDGPGRVDGWTDKPLETADAGTCGVRRIDCREGAVGRPQEAVTDHVRVVVSSRDGSPRVDAARQHVPGRAAGWIECDERGLRCN